MRYFKPLLVVLFFATFLFNACQDENYINLNDNDLTTQESINLQTLLSQINNEYNEANSPSSNFEQDSLCFQFVYPIQLIYNNQNTVSLNGFNGLMEILNNQTPEHHIVGITMPFQVTTNGQTQTISNQEELIALLESCDFTFFNDEIQNSFCFDIVYPINITGENGQTSSINNIQEFLAFLNTQSNGYQANIVFPISVIYNNQTMTINSLYALNELINSCNEGGCNCPEYYSPVCIQTPNGVVEYGNMCFAECDGYTQANVVPCNNGGDCDIFNLDIEVGNCGEGDTFSLTLDFDYNNPDNQFFEVFARDSVYVGIYPLSQLPITIANFPDAETEFDYIRIQINDHPNCFAVAEFVSPNCGGNDTNSGCVCPQVYAPVCVVGPNGNIITFQNACYAECEGYSQNDFVDCNNNSNEFNFGELLGSCFTIQYPVQVQHQGQTITVNSNGELLQYYFPNEAPVPLMTYPVTIIFANTTTGIYTYTVNGQGGLIELINSHCN